MRIKRYIANASFFKKAFFSFLAITIIVSTTLTISLSMVYLNSINKVLEKDYKTILSQTNYSVTYINELAERLSTTLYSDKSVIAFLNAEEKNHFETISANVALRKHLLISPYVDSVYLYNGAVDLVLSTPNGEQNTLEEFYDEEARNFLNDSSILINARGNPITHSTVYNGVKKDICSYVAYDMDKQTGEIKSALIINISVDTLTNSIHSINSQSENGVHFIVTDNSGKIISSSLLSESELEQHVDFSQGKNKLSKIVIDKEKYLSLSSNQNPNGWNIIGLIPQKSIYKDIAVATGFSVSVVVLLLIGAAFACLYLAKKLNKPIDTITKIVRGEAIEAETLQTIKIDEFQFLVSVFSSMKEQNRQFDIFKNETKYSMRQDFLNNITSGNNIYSLDKNLAMLQDLKLEYIVHHQLCLCVVKIDHYKQFLVDNNQKERWALRYAIVNIVDEIISTQFLCEVFSKKSDKFVVLIDCTKKISYSAFTEKLGVVLLDLQEKIKQSLALSTTIAYGSFFKGLEHLPKMYESVDTLTQLKIRYGNGKIITPSMMDETQFEDFEIPFAEENKLIETIISGEEKDAIASYNTIVEQLLQYTYNEIMPYVVHLAYLIYNATNRQYPAIKEESTPVFKTFMTKLSDYEVLEDINQCFINLIVFICEKIAITRNAPETENADSVVSKVVAMIESNFFRKELCLNMISQEIGLSSNYLGFMFKSVTNKSVAKYISDYRMEKVAYYLKTTAQPISEIIEMVGLEKSNYFYTSFKKHFGMSLGKYKQAAPNLEDDSEE